ncbi:MAG TPA: peptidase U32 family protein, partial [bacterium]|nr:peptidase U32 family protein [bacterium]
MKKIELNSPAGNFEKLIGAINYGADAVYLSGKNYGLRKYAGNFKDDDLKKALEFVHSKNKKAYITLNIFAHNNDFNGLAEYLKYLEEIRADAVIISDVGLLYFIKKTAPNLDIFISTQANTLNKYAVKFWQELGVKRIILARELSITEIREIREATDIELEVFIHGAVCISYSGRCFLSKYLTGRDANSGECTHPCRWRYFLVEEKRQGEYFEIEQDESGSYIFNSKDLNAISLLPDFIDMGIDSIKIEGRMKSVYYTASVTAVYRNAIDLYYRDKNEFKNRLEFWNNELTKVSHRKYHLGFYKRGMPTAEDYNYAESVYYRNYDFVGIVCDFVKYEEKLCALVEVRAKIKKGERLEILSPSLDNKEFVINEII